MKHTKAFLAFVSLIRSKLKFSDFLDLTKDNPLLVADRIQGSLGCFSSVAWLLVMTANPSNQVFYEKPTLNKH